MARIEQFVVEGLGHQSYFVGDDESGTAAIVDPRRDVAVYLEAASRAGMRITHVLETHVHNDYITGSRELAAKTGATIVASAADPLEYEFLPVAEGDHFTVGRLSFKTLATPGHTPAHVSYLLNETGEEAPTALFSGGSLLAANAGRTDLLGEGMMLTLTRQQYQTLRRLLDTLPGQVRVYPTHGAGSFCMSTSANSGRTTTIAQERLVNPAALAPNEEAFVQRQIAGYSSYPRYYAHMGFINRKGPRILGAMPTPPPLAPLDVLQRISNGLPLIDGRNRDAFAREHIPGALNIELDSSFATYVGWLLPFNVPLLILIEDEAGRREAVVQLMRIGFEQVDGYLDGGIAAWKAAALPTTSFGTMDIEALHKCWSQHEKLTILDVRRPDEWREGHIPGALHVQLGDLPLRMRELPDDQTIATICRSGHRAEIAASMVAATGREVLSVRGGMEDWLKLELPSAAGLG
ncbi:MAG TPA: MBL fold metallo-hydrolase [Ktedonosporobacter sp.]|jgi:hydroxyacylglutathione hydrolase|nr:MBL fold metallo-hydrolase [Ktedonosporobacter sp.]